MESLKDKSGAEIRVSICCAAYNHGKYLRECLEGFLMQETNFRYEILVHNDASTDDTGKIIEEYSRKYPEIVREIRQSSNQYQAGNRAIVTKFLLPVAKGDLIAICEGDDYWIDPVKLQKQVGVMDSDSSLAASIHSTRVTDFQGKVCGHFKPANRERLINTPEIIKWRHNFCHISSLVYRKNLMEAYPEYCTNCHVGDFPLMLWLSLKGGIYFINREMSTYRKNTPQSWTELYKDCPFEKRMEFVNTEIVMLNGIDVESCHKYSKSIRKKSNRLLIYALWRYRKIKQLRRSEYLRKILSMPFYKSVRILFIVHICSRIKEIVNHE